MDGEEYGCQHGVQRRRVCVSMEVGSKPKKVVAKREEGVVKSIMHISQEKSLIRAGAERLLLFAPSHFFLIV